MDHETETRTIRLTSEIIRCIAKSLLVSAEELERSLWHYSTPTEHSQSSSDCDDAALISSDLKGFMSNVTKLFPGASIRTAGVYTKTTRVGLVIEILSNPDLPPKLTTKDIGRLIEAKTGKRTPWRMVSSNVPTGDFSRALEAIGWRYVPGRGRGGSHFERTRPILIQAA
jgi:hypothetical protein